MVDGLTRKTGAHARLFRRQARAGRWSFLNAGSRIAAICAPLLIAWSSPSIAAAFPDQGLAYAACMNQAATYQPSGIYVADCNPSVGGYHVYWRGPEGWLNPR